MKKSIDFPSVLTVPQSDAEDILLAETLESMEIEVGHWSQNDGETASRDARELAGEAATPKDFIAIRARLVLARLKNYVPDQERIRKVSFNTTPLVLGLLFLAYLGGALTDRFATEGARINLLSPPVLLLLFWNLLIYIGLILDKCGLFPTQWTLFSPVKALSTSFSHMKWIGFDKKSSKAIFASRLTALMHPRLQAEASRALHMAAIAFAIGLLTSIGVRGIGTAYTVGWESTWFADNPELIATMLRAIYDIVPLELFGGTPWPDLDSIVALRFDRLDSLTQSAASVWLLRLMATITVIILLPRLLLTVIGTWKLSRLRKSLIIDVSTNYYREILATKKVPSRHTVLLIDHADSTSPVSPEWSAVNRILQTQTITPTNAWACEISEKLAELPPAATYEILLGFDPAGTPEEEVHGFVLEQAKNFCQTHASPCPVVILNLTPLLKRHGNESETIGSRRALWESFAHQHGLSAIAVDLDNEQAVESLRGTLSPFAKCNF